MGFLCVKAKLKMIWRMSGIDWAPHTKKDGGEDKSFSLQALAKNLTLFSRGL